MNAAAPSEVLSEVIDDAGIARKVRRHLLPLLFLLYIVAYLDRVNVGFASLTMNRELALTSEQYGLLSGIFFWGYFLFEIPSNLILAPDRRAHLDRPHPGHLGPGGARTAFVQNATQLYVARFALGAAEAGFFPGIVYYLSYWFRQHEQAQAIGLFLTALPTASILGGPASGWILDHAHAYGLSSWRWLLFLEALPAILCGLLTYRALPDRPADATFLTSGEQRRLTQVLMAEAEAKPNAQSLTALKALTHPRVLHLTATHFLFLMGLYITGFWMPQSIKSAGTNLSNTVIGLLIIVPNLAGLLSMVLVSRSSDRRAERHWHAAVPLLCAAAALFFVGAKLSVAACVVLWCVAAAGIDGYVGPFWAFPGEFLSGRAAACGFAFINAVGNLGAYFGLSIIGSIATRTGSFSGGFRVISAALVGAAALILALKLYPQPLARAAVAAAAITAIDEEIG